MDRFNGLGGKVITLGEMLIDFVPEAAGDHKTTLDEIHPSHREHPMACAFIPKPGGAPANVAACVAILGGQSAFIGKRGKDGFGDMLLNALGQSGVDTTYFTETEEANTALAFVSWNETGDRSFLFYRQPSADMLLEHSQLPFEALSIAGVLHVGSISLIAEPAKSATLQAVQHARRAGVFVSYDPNWRPALWADEDTGLREMASLYPWCDLIKVNREEADLLAPEGTLAEKAAYWHEQGIPYVIITLDRDGCYYSFQSTFQNMSKPVVLSGNIAGIPVQCVDTTGAGDSFIGALLYGLQVDGTHRLGQPPEELAVDTAMRLKRWLPFAICTSAYVTLRAGAIPAMPTYDEVVAFAKQHNIDLASTKLP